MSEKVVVPPHMFACLDAKGANYIVEAKLPGVKKKDIDLGMHKDIFMSWRARHLHFPAKSIQINPGPNLATVCLK